MTKKDFYNEIVRLTDEIKKTGTAERIFFCAQKGFVETINSTLSDFEKDYEDLFSQIIDFKNHWNCFKSNGKILGSTITDLKNQWNSFNKNNSNGRIFGSADNEETGIFKYDPNVIDTLSFIVFLILAHINDIDIFEDTDVDSDSQEGFFQAIASCGKEYCMLENFLRGNNLITFLEDDYYNNVGALLVDIFDEEFEDLL